MIYCKHEHPFEHSKFESKLNYLQLATFPTNTSFENTCQDYVCIQRSRSTCDQPYDVINTCQLIAPFKCCSNQCELVTL